MEANAYGGFSRSRFQGLGLRVCMKVICGPQLVPWTAKTHTPYMHTFSSSTKYYLPIQHALRQTPSLAICRIPVMIPLALPRLQPEQHPAKQGPQWPALPMFRSSFRLYLREPKALLVWTSSTLTSGCAKTPMWARTPKSMRHSRSIFSIYGCQG